MAELKASNHLLSEARLRAETAHQHLIDAIESISDAFVLFDAQQCIVLFNSRFKAFWSNSRVRISAGMRLTEVKRLMMNNGLFTEEPRGQADETCCIACRTVAGCKSASGLPRKAGG
jgi:PAS domain-containing protein